MSDRNDHGGKGVKQTLPGRNQNWLDFTLMASCMPMSTDGHMASRVAMYDVDSEDCVLNLVQGQSLTIVCSTGFLKIVLNVIELFVQRFYSAAREKTAKKDARRKQEREYPFEVMYLAPGEFEDSKHRLTAPPGNACEIGLQRRREHA